MNVDGIRLNGGESMSKKLFVLLSLAVGVSTAAYITYNSFSQLKDIDYDLLEMEEDEDD